MNLAASHKQQSVEAERLLALVMSGNVQHDPYVRLGELRVLAPVHMSEAFGGWFLSRLDDCLEVKTRSRALQTKYEEVAWFL